MAGSIVTVPLQERQRIQAGATLVSLEAMKMETHIVADKDGVIDRVLVKVGDRVQLKDLPIVLRPSDKAQ